MTMILKPYKDIIALSKEKLDEAMAPIVARQVEAKANMAMLKLDEKILEKQIKIEKSCMSKDLDFDSLIDELDEVALLERRKDQYTKVVEQLFPKTT